MKKGFLLAATALMAAGAMNAKTIDEVRVYLNPGHGSWGPNDRPLATIPYPALESGMPDTCGFFESNTNLWKVLKLGAKLEEAGVKKENIMYSRVKNGPFPYVQGAEDAELYNRNLVEICEEVDANQMDIFLSVHSNAASEGGSTNYPLYLYRGTDGAEGDAVQGSYEMADAMWAPLYSNAIDPTSYYSPTNKNLRGDISFYGSSSDRVGSNGVTYTGFLGVLKHGACGFLSEGYFHTYQPARHRALNQDYCGQEGVRYSRGLISYLGGQAETTGYIMGTVKDLHEKMADPLFNYAPGTNDQWVPINGAVVTLYKAGTKVGEYKVDNNYNGVFVFEGLTPGSDYTIDVTADNYKPLFDEYKAPITVKANETTYPMVFLEATAYEPPAIVYVNYPDPVQPDYIQALPSEMVFAQESLGYGFSGTVTRTLQYGDSTIILTKTAEKAPALYLVNNVDKSIKNISINGIPELDAANPGYMEKIGDVAMTADGKLVAINYSHNQFDDGQVEEGYQRGVTRVYKWDTLDGDPVEWFTSQHSSNNYRANVGAALAVNGPSDDCVVVTTSTNAYSETSVPYIRFINYTVVDNVVASTTFANKSKNVNFNSAEMGTLQLKVSPRSDDNYILDGTTIAPFEFAMAKTNNTDCEIAGRLDDSVLGKAPVGANYFKYAKRAVMVAPFNVDTEAWPTGIKVLDITDGLDNATVVSTRTTTGVPFTFEATAPAHMGGFTRGEDVVVYVVHNSNNVITKLTTAGQEQPVERGHYAYDLMCTKVSGGDDYEFSFRTTTTKERKATIVLTSTTPGDDGARAEFRFDAGFTGDFCRVNISQSDIPEGTYNWAVEIENTLIAKAQQIFASEIPARNGRGGVAVVKDPDSNAYGKIITASGYSQGINIYSAGLSKEGTYFTDKFTSSNSSSPLRIKESEGKIYVNDWSDASAGIWVFDPANPVEIKQLFAGTKDSGGAYTYEGVVVGGGGTGCDFVGTGADRKMYHFTEDYPSANAGNKLVRYDIGEAETITFAPSATFDAVSAKLVNTNVDVFATSKGLFVAQVRSSGNNSAGVPGFMFTDFEGNILYNSGSDMKDLLACGGGVAYDEERGIFAVHELGEGIRVCRTTWSETGVPSFELMYHIPNSAETQDATQLAFDLAGNLCVYQRNSGLRVYSIANSEPSYAVSKGRSTDIVVGLMSGVEGVEAAAATLKVYPNPATDVVNVAAGEEITSIAVFNLAGNAVNVDANVEGSKATLNVNNLAAGSYFVKVNDMQAAKLIKK